MPAIAKTKAMQTTKFLNNSAFENQKQIRAGKRKTNANKIKLITRLTVIMTAYSRCKVSARYRLKLIAVMDGRT